MKKLFNSLRSLTQSTIVPLLLTKVSVSTLLGLPTEDINNLIQNGQLKLIPLPGAKTATRITTASLLKYCIKQELLLGEDADDSQIDLLSQEEFSAIENSPSTKV